MGGSGAAAATAAAGGLPGGGSDGRWSGRSLPQPAVQSPIASIVYGAESAALAASTQLLRLGGVLEGCRGQGLGTEHTREK
jgi:hypothetical protein